MTEFKIANSPKDFAHGKTLIQEYADWLGIDLSFQNFATELDTLHLQYNAPEGALVIAYVDTIPVGCTGIRKSETDIAELKRMYVNPLYRGHKVGKGMLEIALQEAKRLGYRRIRLDTVPSLSTALHLYKQFGFYTIPAYRMNPSDEAIFMEKDLA